MGVCQPECPLLEVHAQTCFDTARREDVSTATMRHLRVNRDTLEESRNDTTPRVTLGDSRAFLSTADTRRPLRFAILHDNDDPKRAVGRGHDAVGVGGRANGDCGEIYSNVDCRTAIQGGVRPFRFVSSVSILLIEMLRFVVFWLSAQNAQKGSREHLRHLSHLRHRLD